MMKLSCELVTDRLPDSVFGRLSAADEAEVQLHLAGCARCRAEAEIVAQLRSSHPEVPVALEARVLGSLRRPVRRPAWRRPQLLPAAATLAMAVIGGVLLWQTLGPAGNSEAPAARAPAEPAYVQGVEDPLLRGGSFLPELTEAELQTLLAKLES